MIRNPKLKVHKEENRVNEQKVVIFCSFFVFLEINKVWMAFRLETGKEDRMNAIMPEWRTYWNYTISRREVSSGGQKADRKRAESAEMPTKKRNRR